jgi:hypothetical protein
MWLENVSKLSEDCKFHPSAKLDEINKVELALEVSFPEELKNLLQESKGIEGSYSLGLIWNIERIKQDNLSFRKSQVFKDLYMPFDNLLFFADAGNGDQFALTIINKEIRNPDIFVWNHENDSREWIAPSLDKYLEWWLTGKLKI